MHSITYKMKYSALELIFGLIGPAIILASLAYPLHDLKIGSLRLGLPAGVANAILIILGAYVTYLSVKLLLIKRATNSQGNRIVLDENNMTFTAVLKYRGTLTTVNYDAIDKVTITDIPETTTTAEEKTLKISMPSLMPKKHEFDAIHMAKDSDFNVLVDTLKRRAVNAAFEGN